MNGFAYPTRLFGRAGRLFSRARVRWSVLDRVLTPGGAVGALTLAFIGISWWWITQDERVPDSATGGHLITALYYWDQVNADHLFTWFTAFNVYPPLVHLVALGTYLIDGFSIEGPILVQNFVFLPLLAIGCYGAGKVAYGPRVGVFAALFALGTPMLISQFHVFMLDAPMAAVAALSVWLLLASDRFGRIGYSAAAGAAVGLGMMTKNTFIAFVAGLVAVALLRGGWRNWRGIVAFVLPAVAIAAPWYLYHLSEIEAYTNGSLTAENATIQHVPRFSLRSFLWYGENAFEHQLYVPLALFAAIGLVVAARRWLQTRRRDDLAPELIAGAVVGYAAMTLVNVKDPRYTLPILVYAAVLGTAWLVHRDGRTKLVSAALLALVVLANTLAVDFGVGRSYQVSLPAGKGERTGHLARKLTFFGPPTFLEGRAEPQRDHVSALMRAAKQEGARQYYIGPDPYDWAHFNSNALTLYARTLGLASPLNNDAHLLKRSDFIILHRFPGRDDPEPCLRLHDGSVVFLAHGGPNPWEVPLNRLDYYCPRRFGSPDRPLG
jgi:hypothetical protein